MSNPLNEINQDNYLDIPNLIVNVIIGDPMLTILLGCILIAYFGLKYRLPVEAIGLLMMIFASAIISYAYLSVPWMIILLISGITIYVIFAKMVNK